MPASARSNPNLAPSYADETARMRPRTYYVDAAKLEATASGKGAVRAYRRAQGTTSSTVKPNRVTTVDAEVTPLRRNVQDAARAVLTWLASVTQHDDADSLDGVVDKCLRPGPDAAELNYTALAEQINQSLGLSLSPKRVQTAVRHLRQSAGQQRGNQSVNQTALALSQRFEFLVDRLQNNYGLLIQEQDGVVSVLQRSVAHDVLCVLRAAAGRLIENDFGEGIPDHVDLDETRERFLTFVRVAVKRGTGTSAASTVRNDLAGLLRALNDYDATAEADMQLVVAGVRVVADLAGPGSLAGLMARLNLLMVGRPMLESKFFVDQMLELAEAAGGLIGERATHAYMGWVRHQPKDRQTPSPNRVRSYCLNNAATHILERLHTGESAGGHGFDTAQRCFLTMQQHDRGFGLLRVTESIMLSVLAEMTTNAEPARDFFQRLGRSRTLELLQDLRRYDNSDALNRLVRTYAESVYPDLKGQLLVLS